MYLVRASSKFLPRFGYLLVGVTGCLRIEDTRTFARAAPLIIPNDDPDGWAIVRGGGGAQNNAERRVSSY